MPDNNQNEKIMEWHLEEHVSKHAFSRMKSRRIDANAIEAALDYGRIVHTRGAVIHAIGRKEISKYMEHGINLEKLDGLQVVCSQDGTIITVYINRNFRGLRSSLGRKGFSKKPRISINTDELCMGA